MPSNIVSVSDIVMILIVNVIYSLHPENAVLGYPMK